MNGTGPGDEDTAQRDASARQIAATNATPRQLAQLSQLANTIAPVLNAVVESRMAPIAAMSAGLVALIERLQAPAFSALSRQVAESFANFERQLLPILATVAESFSRLVLPANLASIDRVTLIKVFEVGEKDGIPLYGVPRARITRNILAAPTSQRRRAILGKEADNILQDCHDALAHTRDSALRDVAAMACKAARAGLDGHYEASQALATVVLDGAITKLLDEELRRLARHSTPGGSTALDDLPLRDALMVVPLARAHLRFYPSRGESVPQEYSRHASVHAPVRRQYSKRNAIQAMLLVTSIVLFVQDTRKPLENTATSAASAPLVRDPTQTAASAEHVPAPAPAWAR